MKRKLRPLLILLGTAALLSGGCGTLSEDAAPGGIQASETGMTTRTARQWQEDTFRRLAY
jgi:hypothetical protein